MKLRTNEQAEAVWEILVKHCGANAAIDSQFVLYFTENRDGEFRFCGNLGFGGKLYFDTNELRVSCYQEDESPERKEQIEKTNEALAKLLENWRFIRFDDSNFEPILVFARATVKKSEDGVYALVWKHGVIHLDTEDEQKARKTAALFIHLWQLGVDAAIAERCAIAYIRTWTVNKM